MTERARCLVAQATSPAPAVIVSVVAGVAALGAWAPAYPEVRRLREVNCGRA